jgi:hypothetical protein
MRFGSFLAFVVLASFALFTGGSFAQEKQPWESITDKEIDAITYEDAEIDRGFVTPLAEDLNHLDEESLKRLEEVQAKFDQWLPGKEKEIGQRVRNWMCLATLPDVGRAEFEAELPYVIFEHLKKEVPEQQLKRALAWVILNPKEGKVITDAKALGFEGPVDEDEVRRRSVIYAKKLLGRLVGKLPPKA